MQNYTTASGTGYFNVHYASELKQQQPVFNQNQGSAVSVELIAAEPDTIQFPMTETEQREQELEETLNNMTTEEKMAVVDKYLETEQKLMATRYQECLAANGLDEYYKAGANYLESQDKLILSDENYALGDKILRDGNIEYKSDYEGKDPEYVHLRAEYDKMISEYDCSLEHIIKQKYQK